MDLRPSLEQLIERAEQPQSPGRRSSTVRPCRDQVREAVPEIRAISARLRSAEPADARGVAMLRVLLRDPSGPCYVRSHPAALIDALEETRQWLPAASQ